MNGSECKEILNQPSGFIHSPDLDNDGKYDTNQNCSWTLTAPEDHVIYLQFLEFDIEYYDNCIYDFVEIWEVRSVWPTLSIVSFQYLKVEVQTKLLISQI